MTGGEACETEITLIEGRALSLQYASPEQLLGHSPSGARATFTRWESFCIELLTGSFHTFAGRTRVGDRGRHPLSVETDPGERQRRGPGARAVGAPTRASFARSSKATSTPFCKKALRKNAAERYRTVQASLKISIGSWAARPSSRPNSL